MGSKEVLSKRKALEEEYQAAVNVTTGQLSNAREIYEFKLKELQVECNHIWDTGEYAMQKSGNTTICPICRKKSKN